MITSWNVNQFLKQADWGDLTTPEKNEIWEENKTHYFKCIMRYLSEKEDLLILHEVPDKRRNHILKELKSFCTVHELEIIEPIGTAGYFKTIAICRKDTYRRCSYYDADLFVTPDGDAIYSNRIVAVEHVSSPDEIIIGLHIPVDAKELWKCLRKAHRKLLKGRNEKTIIYAGDLNTFVPGTVNKRMLYRFMAEGLVDVWLEKGKPHTRPTYMHNGTPERLDYILMTGKDFSSDKIDIEIEDKVREDGYSDHSAITLYMLNDKDDLSRRQLCKEKSSS